MTNSEPCLSSLVYVSRSTLALEGDDAEVHKIVEGAIAHNGPCGVTGSLLYTHLHFAQYLEGPPEEIEKLMASVLRDQRHCDVTIVSENKAAKRQFTGWAMAYSGAIPYLDRKLKPLLNPQISSEDKQQLAGSLISDLQRLSV